MRAVGLLFDDHAELFECSMMPRQQSADGIASYLGDLLEAQLPMMTQGDHLAVGLRELLHCQSQGIELVLMVVFGVDIGLGLSFDTCEIFGSHRFGMARSLSAIITHPIHRDPEEPRLESSLLGVCRLVEFG